MLRPDYIANMNATDFNEDISNSEISIMRQKKNYHSEITEGVLKTTLTRNITSMAFFSCGNPLNSLPNMFLSQMIKSDIRVNRDAVSSECELKHVVSSTNVNIEQSLISILS